jgi:LL-diaminopimelate aminotransferase
MEFSKKMNGLTSAIFSQLDYKKRELIQTGKEVINFSIGTPDIAPGSHIVKAMIDASHNPENYKYAINDLPELICSVLRWYKDRFNVDLEADEVMSLMGSQEGLSHVALTIIDPGDTVLVPDPGYPIFNVGPYIASAKVCKMPLLKQNDFLIDFEAIDPTTAHDAKLMIVSYPNNPVTAVAPLEFYEKLVWFAKKYDIMVVHDNAYAELVFDGKRGESFLAVRGAKDIGVEFNSLSKSYNVTGARISFALGNKEIIRQLKTLKSHLDYGIFLPVQHMAIAALNGPQDCVRETMLTYQSRRDILIEGMGKIGWCIEKPPATMFVWAPIPKNYTSSLKFTFDLLEKTGVVVVPGSSFGELGEGYVRLALVQPQDKILRAIELINESGILI